jgi:hypothetical protein
MKERASSPACFARQGLPRWRSGDEIILSTLAIVDSQTRRALVRLAEKWGGMVLNPEPEEDDWPITFLNTFGGVYVLNAITLDGIVVPKCVYYGQVVSGEFVPVATIERIQLS